MNSRTLWAGLFVATMLCSCAGDASESTGETGEPQAPDVVADAQPSGSEAGQASVGEVHVDIDGVTSDFEYLAESAVVYTAIASSVEVRASAGAPDWFAMRLMQVDLKKLSYPMDLPAPRDMSDPLSVTGSMATIGFGYVDAAGEEWAGPGTIRLEAFGNDGVLMGTFDGVTLPHTDNERPDITLSNGTFRLRISPPW